MLFQMKRYSEKILLPLGKHLINIPANIFTAISCIMSILAGARFYAHLPWLLIPSLLLIEIFDQLDGVVDRLQGPTAFGAYLDLILDRYGDFAIFIGILFGEYTLEWVVICGLLGTIMTTYARAKVEALGIESMDGIGSLEKIDQMRSAFWDEPL
ncbi:MAG: CDP-alcohol phosphatidyltransferase family protein [Promethearchaeota archaeon]